jgi:hypothetical protein
MDAAELLQMQQAIHRHLKYPWLTERRESSTCAVVGSSGSLIGRSYGREIDRADVVLRVNQAPATRQFQQDVGTRTTVRVWGFIPMPWHNVTVWDGKAHPPWQGTDEEQLLLYCPPVRWVSICWKEAMAHPLPRFAPSAHNHLAKEIGLSRNKHPSSGAMAVRLALAICGRVVVYGFGDVQPSSQKEQTPRPQKGCGRYYQILISKDKRTWVPCNKKKHAKAYIDDSKTFHQLDQEWEWLKRLHTTGQLVWKELQESGD